MPPTLDVTVAGSAATIGLIVVLFALDLFVSRPGHAHTVGFRQASLASIFHISVALASSGVRVDRRVGLRHAAIRRLHRREEPGRRQPLHYGYLQDDAIPEVQTSTS